MSDPSRVQKLMSGGRVTIPLDLRTKFRMKEGDFVMVRQEQNHILIYPVDFGPRKQK